MRRSRKRCVLCLHVAFRSLIRLQEEEQAKREEKEAAEAAKAAAKLEAEGADAVAEGTETAQSGEAAPTLAIPLVDPRMTKEQLNELAEALAILTAKSSIAKERDELHELLEDNLLSEQVSCLCKTRLCRADHGAGIRSAR